MATISSPGLGSGLDVSSIVSQLVAAEGLAPSERLDQTEAELQAELSAYGALKIGIEAFQSSLADLADASSFATKQASSDDSEIAVATATEAAAAGSYALDVAQLAEAHSLVTDSNLAAAQITSLTDELGTGSLTFKFGTTDYDAGTDTYTSFTQDPDATTATVNITDGTLTGIRDAINEADIGVSASIIFDGSYYRLTLNSAEDGVNRSMEISVNDDDLSDTDASGLSVLSFNSASNNMEQTNAGQDAQLTVNGLAVTSSSNSLTETIEGLTINLLGTGTSNVSVSQDTTGVASSITSFVDSYNSLIRGINTLTSYNPETDSAGVLNGDSLVRSIRSQVDQLLTTPVSGVSGQYSILAEIGITRNTEDGTLDLDSEILNDAISSNLSDVMELFAVNGRMADEFAEFSGYTDDSVVGDYAVNISQLATQGQLAGAAAANLTITAGVNDALDFTVDGLDVSITLSAGTYTAYTLATELQSRLNGLEVLQEAGTTVSVSQSVGVLTLTSDRYGSASLVEVTGGNGASDLLGGSPTATTGLDVEGTIGGVTANGSGQTLTGTGIAAGLAIDITGGATGDRGVLTLTRGFADQLDDLLENYLADDGILASITESLNGRIEDVGDDREALADRLASYEERVRAQFTALDVLVSSLQSTSNFLSTQLASIPVIGARTES